MQEKHKKELIKKYHSNHYTCPKCFHHAWYIDCSACEPIEKTLQGNDDAFCHYFDKDKDQRCDWKGKVKDLLPENLEAPPTEEELKISEYHSNHKTCPNCKRKNSIFFNLRNLIFDESVKELGDRWCCCISCEWRGLIDDLVK